MHYALNPRTFLFSHYFYTGLRVAIGVIGLTSLVLWYSDLSTAMTVCIGALCTSFMDLPNPLRHKYDDMQASVLLCTAVALVITLCAPIHWLLELMVVLVSFMASMMLVYGKKTMPLQFSALFVMTLSMENKLTATQGLLHTGLFFAGAAVYMAYAMAAAWLFRNRIKQQVLAEALFELARYIEIKSEFYDMHTDLHDQFNLLVRQQSTLAEKQQTSRDLILRGNPGERDAVLIQVHFGMLDLYELILSTHTEYGLLRRHLADADVLMSLCSVAHKAAQDTESIAYAITRGRPSYGSISYQAEKQVIEQEIAHRQQRENSAHDEGLTVLRTSYTKLCAIVDTIEHLHRATRPNDEPLPILPGADMTPFLTKQKYEFALLFSNLHWQSPTFRFALRIAMAIAFGLFIAGHLPYTSHGYWIVLTIAIVLKPTFSMTKQRREDRLIGTVIGCMLTAIIVHYVHAPAALLALLFLATIATSAFTYVKYRYTAIAASMQILLQISLLIHTTAHVIGERVFDTFIGVVIATCFSFVFPSWEYRALPRLINEVLLANQRYVRAGCDLLIGKVTNDFVYRICRKGLFDSLAGMSSALTRMLDEPVSKHRAVEDIHIFIVQNYLIAAHIAALRILLRRHSAHLPKELVNFVIQKNCRTVEEIFAELQKRLKIILPDFPAPDDTPANDTLISVPEGDEVLTWSGWGLLQRRLSLFRNDTERIHVHAVQIARALAEL